MVMSDETEEMEGEEELCWGCEREPVGPYKDDQGCHVCIDCYREKHDEEVTREVITERQEQRRHFYDEDHDDTQGDVQWSEDLRIYHRKLNDVLVRSDYEQVRRRAIQLAAMSVALVQHLDRKDR
jgi:hypothetical protein